MICHVCHERETAVRGRPCDRCRYARTLELRAGAPHRRRGRQRSAVRPPAAEAPIEIPERARRILLECAREMGLL